MIIIQPYRGTSYDTGFIVSGHSDYDEHGKDIVCASVSFLSQVIGQALQRETDAVYSSSSGMTTCRINVETLYSRCLMRAFQNGMFSLTTEYPDFVEYKEYR